MPSMTKTVFLKEIRETLRDKRVILGVIIFPLLITPLLLAAVTFFATKKVIDQETSILPIHIIAEGQLPSLTDKITNDESFKVTFQKDRETSIKALQARTIRAALLIHSDAQTKLDTNASAQIEIIYDQANETSEAAKKRLRKALRNFDSAIVETRLSQLDLKPEFLKPTKIQETNIASKESMGGFILSTFLPYIIVMGAAFGGMTTAFDLCAGEKERGTMETLLVSPASRYQIVQGKLLAIFVISLGAAVCFLGGFLLPIQSGLSLFKEAIGDSISISYQTVGTMLIIVVPLALLTSSGLLAISAFARNQKEAQTYIFPFIIAILFPAMLSSILGAENPLYTAFIPVLNIALTMKQILSNTFEATYFALSLGSSIAYALIAMRAVTALFQRESILFRA